MKALGREIYIKSDFLLTVISNQLTMAAFLTVPFVRYLAYRA